MRFPTIWYVRPAKPQISQSLCQSLEYSMADKLLTEHHLEFISLNGGYTGSSESRFVKMPHCWKSRVAAHLCHLSWAWRSMAQIQDELGYTRLLPGQGVTVSNPS